MIDTKVKFGEVQNLAAQIEKGSDHVHFQNIMSNENGGIVLVAFEAGQKLDRHVAPAELMVNVLEGKIEFTMLDTPHTLRAGQFMLVGAEVPHSVKALADSKMMLIKVKP